MLSLAAKQLFKLTSIEVMLKYVKSAGGRMLNSNLNLFILFEINVFVAVCVFECGIFNLMRRKCWRNVKILMPKIFVLSLIPLHSIIAAAVAAAASARPKTLHIC